jgi:hypothetical protein
MLDCKLLEPEAEKEEGRNLLPRKRQEWLGSCTTIKITPSARYAKHSISHGLPCIAISKLKEVNLAGFEKNICYVL